MEDLFELWNDVTEAIEAEAQHEAREDHTDEAMKEMRLDRQQAAGLLIDQGHFEQGRAILTEMLEQIRHAQAPRAAVSPPLTPQGAPAVPPAGVGSTWHPPSAWEASGTFEF
uniref:Uncharacterized protein n=1 Tax=Prymnesium polylepis TaxID=72548 RepID=A0A7S4HVI4_9EUKA